MSYAGHVLDMIKRMKANRALQKKRRSSFKDRYKKSASTGKKGKAQAAYNEMSDAQKKTIRNRLIFQLETDQKKQARINLILAIVFLFLMYQLYVWFFT